MFNFLKVKLTTLIPNSLVLLLLIMILCITSGCTHTREITTGNQAEYFKEINSYDGGRKMTIVLTNASKFETNLLTVKLDSTYFMRDDIKQLTAVNTTDIMQINQNYIGMGAAEGFGLGFSLGIIPGLLIGSAIHVHSDSFKAGVQTFVNNAESGMLIGGSLGGILGILLGSTNESTNSYIFNDNIELYQNNNRIQK